MNRAIAKELRKLDRVQARLARKRKALLDEQKQQAELGARLDSLVKHSGFKSPRALVEALVSRYRIHLPGAKPRRRTRITGHLRDAVKKAVHGGLSMNAASRHFSLSYAVVMKIMRGGYDPLP